MENFMKFLLAPVLAFLLVTSELAAQDVSAFQLSTPREITINLLQTPKPAAVQRAFYQDKISRIRTHHLALPIPISLFPSAFSSSIVRSQIIKPRPEALLSDGILVTAKPAVTTMAKMDYNYLSTVA